MPRDEELPIIPAFYDFVLWLNPKIAKFPRDQRFVLGEHMERQLYETGRSAAIIPLALRQAPELRSHLHPVRPRVRNALIARWPADGYDDPRGGTARTALWQAGVGERSQEVHHGVALPVAVATLEVDRHVAVGTHGNGVAPQRYADRAAVVRAPNWLPASGCDRIKAPTASRWASSKTMAPSIQAISTSCLFFLMEPVLLADGDVFDRTSDQDLSAGPVGRPWPLCFASGGRMHSGFRMLTGFRIRSRIRCSGS